MNLILTVLDYEYLIRPSEVCAATNKRMQRATCSHLAHFWSWRSLLFFDKKRIPESVLAKAHVIETTREGTIFFEFYNAPQPSGPYLVLERVEAAPSFVDLPHLRQEVKGDLAIFLRTTALSPENKAYLENVINDGIGSPSFEKPEFKLLKPRNEGNY